MQILANMSNLENMDEQQLYEHYEFLKQHGYINDEDINHQQNEQRLAGGNDMIDQEQELD